MSTRVDRWAEDFHFRGLPKVKVMIHEYEPGNPFRSDLYPEPKFDDLSRVRVLHIFRDRGGHEEHVDPPFDILLDTRPALTVLTISSAERSVSYS